MDNKFYVINEDGIRVDARALSKFTLNSGKSYLTYTYDEYNDDGMIKIYVSGIVDDNGIFSYREISSDDEWNDIKTILKTLARDENESFPETIKCDYRIIGEEISIRKAKKLLVSEKFANVLASKYSEENEVVAEPELEIPAYEPIVEEPVKTPEPELEKTIKIPTFEELQARNKNIQAAMETVKETPIITPKPVESAPVREEPKTPTYESRNIRVDYEEKFKKDVEPVLLDVYAKQQKHIEELEEELSKTKFDLFEKQKEALTLSNEKEEIVKKSQVLEEQLNGVQKKMDGILSVLQNNDN
ncbi:MAG: DUF1292 domain-containing protein [Bacilli bacterium]|nr:DUF1292 domain-containing protein [Bacilli bacterium]